MTVFEDFILFIKNPGLSPTIEINTFSKGFYILRNIFLLILISNALISLIIITPLDLLNLMPSQKQILDDKFSLIKVILIAPVLEELLFRLPLKISLKNLSISFCMILFVLLSKINYSVAFKGLFVSFVILLPIVNKTNGLSAKTILFYNDHFPLFFYFQACLFGFLHLPNYNLNMQHFFLFPLFIVSYIILGCILGYLRVRYSTGIILCILTHMTINSLYCLLFY